MTTRVGLGALGILYYTILDDTMISYTIANLLTKLRLRHRHGACCGQFLSVADWQLDNNMIQRYLMIYHALLIELWHAAQYLSAVSFDPSHVANTRES